MGGLAKRPKEEIILKRPQGERESLQDDTWRTTWQPVAGPLRAGPQKAGVFPPKTEFPDRSAFFASPHTPPSGGFTPASLQGAKPLRHLTHKGVSTIVRADAAESDQLCLTSQLLC